MRMKKKPLLVLFLFLLFQNFGYTQVTTGPKEIKWMMVGDLQNWFANGGAEAEYGRRERITAVLQEDQNDGLRYRAQYEWKQHCASKALHIGTTNFADPVTGETYPHKVVAAGPRAVNLLNQLMPYEFKLVGKYDHPKVYVDGVPATDMEYRDKLDEINLDLIADRMIVNKLHSSMGVDITRKILAFSQQNHNNYFIYEYIFKNTGIYDREEHIMEPVPTLNDVVFHFQYRYAFAKESIEEEWCAYSGINWGRNAVNHCVGPNVGRSNTYFHNIPVDFNAQYSWYGPHSQSPGWDEDVGHPDHDNGTIMSGVGFVGTVTLHADKAADNKENDRNQPTTTKFLGADRDAQSGIDQYNKEHMTRLYQFCTAGHPEQTHAEQVVESFANLWGDDAGGYIQGQGFTGYTLEPGDSVRIVLAEAVAGIDRPLNRVITYNWFNNLAPFTLPVGGTTNDRNEYKNECVWTGEDSLMQTFRRAIDTYNKIYNENKSIPQPPPPPDEFFVEAGGNQITLRWSNSAEDWTYFNGYRIYRTEGDPCNIYQMIWSCDNSVNEYIDTSPKRGFDYYYYIVTKDDGSQNDYQTGIPLESSKFYTMTNLPASLKREAGKNFDDLRIVPNPYNIRARKMQFGLDTPDRLAFYGLPPYCVIKIYTERGDLVKTINHTDTSGDELWDSLTSSEQLVVSGLYIAYFEVTKDGDGFKKGENTIRKFVIIR